MALAAATPTADCFFSCLSSIAGTMFCELRGTGGGGMLLNGLVAMGEVIIGGKGTSLAAAA